MSEGRLARWDEGGTNERIFARRENLADFRRVESASLKYHARLHSPEGKRMFARLFYSFQLSVHYIETQGRMKLPAEAIDAMEDRLREMMRLITATIDKSIDWAEELFKQRGIEQLATYETVPMELEVGVISSLGRRFFEVLHKLDQVMPLLQTLEIEELARASIVDRQRSDLKSDVRRVAIAARRLSNGVRVRIAALAAESPAGDGAGSTASSPGEGEPSAMADVGAVAATAPVDGAPSATPHRTPDEVLPE